MCPCSCSCRCLCVCRMGLQLCLHWCRCLCLSVCARAWACAYACAACPHGCAGADAGLVFVCCACRVCVWVLFVCLCGVEEDHRETTADDVLHSTSGTALDVCCCCIHVWFMLCLTVSRCRGSLCSSPSTRSLSRGFSSSTQAVAIGSHCTCFDKTTLSLAENGNRPVTMQYRQQPKDHRSAGTPA